MNGLIFLAQREVNWWAKATTISKYSKEGENGYKLVSSCDECNYIYIGKTLVEAVEAYEKDTMYQGMTAIEYYTEDADIAREFNFIRLYLERD